MEISRPTKFILDRGAKVSLVLTSTHYRASPIVQGGLEIPCRVEIRMPPTVKNKEIVKKYEEMVGVLYYEPDECALLGSFLYQNPVISAPKAAACKRKTQANELQTTNKN